MTLPDEIAAIKAELGDGATTEVAVAQMFKDAGIAWKMLQAIAWRETGAYILHANESERFGGAGNLVARLAEAIERPETIAGFSASGVLKAAGLKDKLPTAAQIRRMRFTCTVVPQILRPVARDGIGRKMKSLWSILWQDAQGIKSYEIAKQYGIKRNRVFTIRRAAYKQIADTIDSMQLAIAA